MWALSHRALTWQLVFVGDGYGCTDGWLAWVSVEIDLASGHSTAIVIVVVLVHLIHHCHHLHLLVHLGIGLILALHGLAGLLDSLLLSLVPLWSDAAEEDYAGETAAEDDDADNDSGDDASGNGFLGTPISACSDQTFASVSLALASMLTELTIAAIVWCPPIITV